MKIGIDIRTLMDPQYSGVSEYTLNLVGEILRLDRENEYRLFYNSAKDVSARMPKFDYPNVKIIRKRIPNKIFNWPMQKISRRPEIDKILGVDVFFSPNIAPLALSKDCERILTVHDLSFLRFPEFFNFKRRLWHRMIGVKKMIKEFDKIVAVSENTKNDIVELCGVLPEKIKVVYSGTESEYKALNSEFPELGAVRRKYGLPEKFILFLGTVEPRKNIEGLIGAYNKFRESREARLRVPEAELQLVIAGGRGWKSESIYKEWKKSKYEDDIKFLGYVDKKDKVYLYNLASLFVYPSFYEGFGFPPLEAMACGTPVITSFASSLPEIVGGAGLMVDPCNIADMARAIELVLSDEKLREDLARKGLERANRFGWEKAAKEFLSFITN